MTETTAVRQRTGRLALWRVLTVVTGWFMLLFVGAYLIAPASILSLVMADLSVGETTAAALVSMPQIAATVIGIPIGIYLDRVESRSVVPVAAGILLSGSILDWVAAGDGLVSFFIASRLLAGVGMFVLWVVSIDVASRAFSAERRATATSVIISGYPAGYAVGQFGTPRLAEIVSWQGVFPVFGASVLLMSLAFYVSIGQAPLFQTSTESLSRSAVVEVLRNRNVWAVVTVTILGYSLYMIFNSWMPTYMTREFGLSVARSGSIVALFPAVGILARPVGGWLSDSYFSQSRRPVFALAFVGATLIAGFMYTTTTIGLLIALIVLAGAFIQLQIGVMYQSIREFVGPSAGGTAVAIASVAGWLGSFVAPVVVGGLVGYTGGYTVVFVFAIGIGLMGALTTWVMAESGSGVGVPG